MLCPNCKKEIENGSTFCEHCGTRVKKSKKWLWITLSVILMSVIATIVIITIQEQKAILSQGLVDLGLPSGTLWKNANEGGDYTRYTYDEAVSRFGNKLPTKQQLEELKNKCTWTWTGSGYKVIGPNGNSIYLPAAGYRDCDGDVYGVGTYGRYWSSSPGDSDYAWYLYFNPSELRMGNYFRCRGSSVRLVMNP